MTFSAYETHYRLDSRAGIGSITPAQHKIFSFPGGEPHIVFKPNAVVQIAYLQGATPEDIITLGMWADAIKRSGRQYRTIAVIPYLPAARADRGTPLGAKVYADIINSFGIDDVVCLDPHSDVAPALYERLTTVPLTAVLPLRIGLTGVIAPDQGAAKRAADAASLLAVPVVQAHKKRDFATGKLSGFGCDKLDPEGRYLLVDDICDGGGTFVGLADTLRDEYPDTLKLSLWVTHGIFSKGPDELEKRFEWIGTTDSHENTEINFMSRIHVEPVLNTLVQAATR